MISFCTIVIVDEFAYSTWYQNHMSKSHYPYHVIVLHIYNYCEPPLIKKHDLNSAVLSAIWKETHTCSILKWVDKWHTSNLAVLVRFT